MHERRRGSSLYRNLMGGFTWFSSVEFLGTKHLSRPSSPLDGKHLSHVQPRKTTSVSAAMNRIIMMLWPI